MSMAIKNMRGQGYDSVVKDDNGFEELEDLKNQKYISLEFYYCLDTYVNTYGIFVNVS